MTAGDRIRGLDGLRAIAVSLVLLTHLTYLGNQLGLGGFGVRMFFVLSGYLIIGILYGQREQIEVGSSTFGREWRAFNIRRAFRILPPYFAIVIFMVTVYPMDGHQLLFFATYTENFDIAFRTFEYPAHGGHLWSLCVEEQFYLLAAPLILLVPTRWTRSVCWIAIVMSVVGAIALLAAGWPSRTLYVGPTNFGMMALGGLIALAPRKRPLPNVATPVALVAFLAVAFGAEKLLPTEGSIVASLLLSPLLAAVVIYGVANDQNHWLTRILDLAPIRAMGRISYMVYLIHPFVDVEALFGDLPGVVRLAADVAATVGIATVSWFVFESPMIALGRRLAGQRRAATEFPSELRA
jgi:peptidoglycan/LPS O-acetylase OafA/YrhL